MRHGEYLSRCPLARTDDARRPDQIEPALPYVASFEDQLGDIDAGSTFGHKNTAGTTHAHSGSYGMSGTLLSASGDIA